MGIPATTGNLVSSLTGMQIGDYIPCRYTATTSGAVGAFSELGTSTATEIPVAGSATPNGLFYFVKADKGLLIADRVVQHSISWDTLNAGKMVEGKTMNPTIHPILTANNVPSPYAVSASSITTNYDAYKAFDGSTSTCWLSATSTVTGWLKIDLGSIKSLKEYSLVAYNVNSSPKNWTFEGSNDNTNWTVLHTVTNQTGWVAAQERVFDIGSIVEYRYYRINISANNGDTQTAIGEFKLLDMMNYSIRSLSGGNSYIDANGNSVTTDQSLGAWPPNNEWDAYIVNSDLGGKITKGDDNVWHWNGIFTWIRDTPSVNIATSSLRSARGKTTVNKFDTGNSSTTAIATYGFRPVLTYKEQ